MTQFTRSNNVAAVILAAGGSTRFGSPKQLFEYNGQPLVRRAAITAAAAELDPVIVVLGAHADEVGKTLTSMGSLTLVTNADWHTGQASSLALGIEAAIAANAEAAVVMLADQPLVDAQSLERFVTAFRAGHRVIAAAYEDTFGAPALFGAEHFRAIMSLSGDHGAGRWLKENSSIVTTIRMDSAAVDVDSPEDAAAIESGDEL